MRFDYAKMNALVSEEDMDLFISARMNDVDAMSYLIGVNSYSTFALDESLLMVCLRRRRFEALEILIDAGADLRYRGFRGKTCLEFAEQGKVASLVDLIQEKMGKSKQIVKPRDEDVRLILASKTGAIKDLIQALRDGADPNALDRHEYTPLMNAAYRGYYSICKHLVGNGANLTYSINGEDALSLVTPKNFKIFFNKSWVGYLGRIKMYYWDWFRIRRLVTKQLKISGQSVATGGSPRKPVDVVVEGREELDDLLCAVCRVTLGEWQERKVRRGIGKSD